MPGFSGLSHWFIGYLYTIQNSYFDDSHFEVSFETLLISLVSLGVHINFKKDFSALKKNLSLYLFSLLLFWIFSDIYNINSIVHDNYIKESVTFTFLWQNARQIQRPSDVLCLALSKVSIHRHWHCGF